MNTTRLITAILGLCLGAGVIAQETGDDTGIPPQPLNKALEQFADQSGLQIIYVAELAEGKATPGAKHNLSDTETLDQLLASTGLQYEFLNDNTVTVQAAADDAGGDSDSGNRRTAGATPRPVMMAQNQAAPTRERKAEEERKREEKAETPLEEIIVTGTNIKGVAPAGSPVIVLDQETISRSGYTSTEQLLQSLPQNVRAGAGGAVADAELSPGTLAGLNSTKGSGVNLRGLGSVATLTLINGRRIAASSSGTFTDISLIPINAIERVEVLPDGASAIYGADAVAGVVNFILKQDYEGSESQARFGATTEEGREEVRLTHTLGSSWETGNALVVLDYLKQTELGADERDSTADVNRPTSIFPENKQLSFVFSGRQQLAPKWSVQTDAQYARAKRFSYATVGGGTLLTHRPVDIDRLNAGVSLVYNPAGDWEFTLDGIVSSEDIKFASEQFDAATGAPMMSSSSSQNQYEDQWSAGLKASGTLFRVAGGRVGLAVGAAHRAEDYLREVPLFALREPADRRVDSAFAELHFPLVSATNSMRGVQRLEVSLAGRYDDYSDFGDTVNPKVGVSWSPFEHLELRASYSTSFRAPSAGRELHDSQAGTDPNMFIFSFPGPDGVTEIPIVNLFGSQQLEPEESENWTFGFTFRPATAPGLEISASYYDVAYNDRIITPPFDFGALSDPALQVFVQQYATPAELQAAVQAIAAGPVVWFDRTGPTFAGGAFGPNPENLAVYTYDTRWTNAGAVDISGFDFTVDYGFAWRESHVQLGLNANLIAEINSKFTPTSPAIDLVATTGNPSDWRVRGTAAWTKGRFDTSLAVNYVDSYTDTSGLIDAPVRSYTTVDANVRIALGRTGSEHNGAFMTVGATNLLDEGPPYIATSRLGSHYDGANASPLGRMVWLDISKRW